MTSGAQMTITFPVLTDIRPIGGAIAMYEIANAMCRRGHIVNVMHVGAEVPIWGPVSWMTFESGIRHVYPGDRATVDLDMARLEGRELGLSSFANYLPDSDFVAGYDDRLPERLGLPFVFVQGVVPFVPGIGDGAYRLPCPKVCVSRWLVDVGRERGASDEQLVYVPNGLSHEKFRLRSPIEERASIVSTMYRDHPQKGAAESLAALAEVKRRMSDVGAIVFGPHPPAHDTAPWMTVAINPPQEYIVDEIYNRSRVFLCASRYEGFGLPSVEAMACGAALVTTANGGSDEYAIHEETALVCKADDVAGMADAVERLLQDDELRVRLANTGMRYVRERVDWDSSAARLETFLHAYAADPARYLC